MAVSAPQTVERRARRRRPDQLTGGRHGLSAEEVRASQRARILAAMTAAVGEHGYHGVRVSDVVDRAGVSRRTFYELFAGKDDCFAAAYGEQLERLLAETFAAFDVDGAWVDRLRVALATLLGTLAREPDVARLCFAEAPAAAGATARRREAGMRELAGLFAAPGLPDGAIGDTLREGRVSELSETLRRETAAGKAEELHLLLPDVMCAMVLPFLGVDAAQRELAGEAEANAAPAR